MQKSINKTWIWIFVLLLLFSSITVMIGSNKPKEYPPFLSTSPAPTGVKAFYTYLEKELDSVERWKHSPSRLETSENTLLIMVEPSLISEQSVMNHYLEFVEEGNTILIFKRNVEGLFDLSTEFAMVVDEPVTIKDYSGTEFKGSMLSQMRIRPEAKDLVLLEDRFGAVAIKREIGKGNLIAANSPDWLTNEYILQEDNLSLIIELIEEENWNSIMLDEFTHHSTTTQSFTNIYPMWLLVGGFQLILITLFWLLFKGKRFGPILTPREDYVRYSDERITALAAWYQKGKAYQDSLANQAEYLRLVLREKWGISYQKEWRDLEDILSQKVKTMKLDELALIIEEIEVVLKKNNMTKQEYVLWAKRIDRLRKEVEEG